MLRSYGTLSLALLAVGITQVCPVRAATIQYSAPKSIPYTNSSTYQPAAYAAGDFNGDGNTDVILGTRSTLSDTGSPQFQFLKGDGKGGFTSSMISVSASTVGVILVGDFNGDGHLDFIHAYGGNLQGQFTYSGAATVYLGDGKGNFHQSATMALPEGYATAVLGDFNNDGKIDFLVSTDDSDVENGGPNTQEDIFLNNGDGTFTHAPSILDAGVNEAFGAVGDFNGDGKLDFTILDTDQMGFRLLTGNGNGTFNDTGQDIYTFDSAARSMASMDFNGDGKADLLVSLFAKNIKGAQPRVATLLAKQTQGFYWDTATFIPNNVAFDGMLKDLDGDGKPDYLYVDDSHTIRVLKGEGHGNFAGSQEIYDESSAVTNPSLYFSASLKTGGLPAIFFSGAQKGSGYPGYTGYFAVLLNQTK